MPEHMALALGLAVDQVADDAGAWAVSGGRSDFRVVQWFQRYHGQG